MLAKMLAALSPLVKVRVDCQVLPETWPLPPQILIPQGFVLDNENGSGSYKWHDLCSPSAAVEWVVQFVCNSARH